jgi:hypothetical protein
LKTASTLFQNFTLPSVNGELLKVVGYGSIRRRSVVSEVEAQIGE